MTGAPVFILQHCQRTAALACIVLPPRLPDFGYVKDHDCITWSLPFCVFVFFAGYVDDPEIFQHVFVLHDRRLFELGRLGHKHELVQLHHSGAVVLELRDGGVHHPALGLAGYHRVVDGPAQARRRAPREDQLVRGNRSHLVLLCRRRAPRLYDPFSVFSVVGRNILDPTCWQHARNRSNFLAITQNFARAVWMGNYVCFLA